MKRAWFVVAALALLVAQVDAIDPSQCIAPLGMENGSIKDEDITASSSFDSGNVGPHHGRLKTERNGGAWCPSNQATTEPEEWLQIDLKTAHMITATATQGRFGNAQGVEYTEAYMLEYWRPRLAKWIRYRNIKGDEVISGNVNTYLEYKNELDPPIWASKIRFLPYSYHQRTVCMRVEVYGCKWTDGIVSYTMPQGDKRGANWELYDSSYDGLWDGETLKHGLGTLTDGKFGRDDFKLSLYDASPSWVGWKNDSHLKPIEIKFEFDRVREFSAVHIFCNNQFTKDIQVFSEAKIFFSIGGKRYKGEPITYEYMEDHIFENSRNVTIKLHHRIGRFIKIQLLFAARWILISEITFDSTVAHGNFSPEVEPMTTLSPLKKTRSDLEHKIEIPVPVSKLNDPVTVTIIVLGGLVAITMIISVAYLVIRRFRRGKPFRSPNSSNVGFPTNTLPHVQPESVYGISEKGSAIEAYGVTEIDDYRKSHSTMKSSMRSTLPLPHPDFENYVETNDYQEPYQTFKYTPYYSYNSVMMEMQSVTKANANKYATTQSDTYDYAVPEIGTLPLLSSEKSHVPQPKINSINSTNSRMSLRNKHCDSPKSNKSPTEAELLAALKKRSEQITLLELPRHRLRMLSELSKGAFGTTYIAEADGIPEYASSTSVGKRLVALKFAGESSCEKDQEFFSDVRILASLEHPNLARVLGICSQEKPLCVVMEYLEHGDLCQFLKSHAVPQNNQSPIFNCLLYIGAQVAAGMRYLESQNFVHRDLATRNCLIGKAYQIKICDFGTYNDIYTNDYYKVDGNMPLPIRWMPFEAVFNAKYTNKSDVWAFAVTLWEILTLCRWSPFEELADPEVLENLTHFHCDDGQFKYLPRPVVADKDICEIMRECWRKDPAERPHFTEIHLFLERKILGYAPT